MNNSTRYVVYTGVLLALAVVFQMLRTIFPFMEVMGVGNASLSTLIIGSLVNLCLIIAVWYVGFWSGAAISLLSVLIAYMQGHLPAALPQMILVVLIGNLTIVAITWVMREKNKPVGVVIGSLAKTAVLFVLVQYMIIPLWVNVETLHKQPIVDKLTKLLSINFSWPQLVTGLIGGFLAILILPRLKKSQQNTAN